MSVCLSTSDISLGMSALTIALVFAINIIGFRKITKTHYKAMNDQAMIFGVQNGYTDDQLIEICKHNKIEFPRDTVAFYRYYYQLKDKT